YLITVIDNRDLQSTTPRLGYASLVASARRTDVSQDICTRASCLPEFRSNGYASLIDSNDHCPPAKARQVNNLSQHHPPNTQQGGSYTEKQQPGCCRGDNSSPNKQKEQPYTEDKHQNERSECEERTLQDTPCTVQFLRSCDTDRYTPAGYNKEYPHNGGV